MPMFWSKKPKAEKIYDKTGSLSKDLQSKSPKSKKSTKVIANVAKETISPKVNTPSIPTGVFDKNAEAIVRPLVTEKSGILSASGMYTFEISQSANKHAVARAITTLYKVTPVRVAIINMPTKNVFLRGKKGTVSGKRKAIVTLKKGETINFV